MGFAAFTDWTSAASTWSGWTGTGTPTVTRSYQGTGPWTIGSDMTAMIAAGCKILISMTPAYNPVSSTDYANIQSFMEALVAAGADCDVCIWSEPYYNGLTSAQYIAAVQYYGPAIRPYYPMSFQTANGSVVHNSEASYYPGDAYVDKVSTDYYASGYVAGDRLTTIAAVASGASPPKPFCLWEINGSPASTGQSQANVTAFFEYVQSFMLGQVAAQLPIGDICLFNGAPGESVFGCDAIEEASFEGGNGNWLAAGNTSVANSSAQHHSGADCLAVTCTGSTPAQIASCIATAYATEMLPVAVGDSVDGAIWVRAAATSRTVTCQVQWYTSTGTEISVTAGTGVADSTSAWTQAVISGAVAPATAAWARLFPAIASAAASEVHYFDDAELRDVEGDNPNNTTTIEFGWDYRIALFQALYEALNTQPPLAQTPASPGRAVPGAATPGLIPSSSKSSSDSGTGAESQRIATERLFSSDSGTGAETGIIPLPKMATLVENFRANDFSAVWGNSYGTYSWSPGSAAIQCDTGYSSALGSTVNYDLTSSSIYVGIAPYIATSSATFLFLTSSTGNAIMFGQTGVNLAVYKAVAGVQTSLFTTTYNATSHAWWRIRESAGTVFFDTAPDGATWTNQYSTADTTFSGTVLTALQVDIQPGDYGSDPTGTTYLYAVNSPRLQASTDAGTGAETYVLTARTPSADSGTGADAQSMTARVPSADAGTGLEAQSLIAKVPNPDSGTGAETQTVIESLASADAGTGLEALALTASLASADAGTGAELQALTIPSADAGAGTETQALTARLPSSDAGTGADAQSVRLPSSDIGTGAELQVLTARVPSSDSGTGAEQQGIALASSDSGTGAEAQAVAATALVSDVDSGVGVDTESVSSGSMLVSDTDASFTSYEVESGLGRIPSSDAATGAEVLAIRVVVFDGGTGSESQSSRASMSNADSGTGADAQVLTLASSDTGTGSELQATADSISDVDAGTGADVQVLRLADVDAGTGADTGLLTALARDTDAGLGADADTLMALETGADAGLGVDAGLLRALESDLDAGLGADAATLPAVRVRDADAGTGTETQFYEPSGTMFIVSADSGRVQEGDTEAAVGSDFATGADAQSPMVVVPPPGADLATGAESGSFVVLVNALADIDGGTGAESWATAGGRADLDSGDGADSQLSLYAPAGADGGTGGEPGAYQLGIWAFPPPWLFNPSGGLRVVWHEGQPDEVVVREWEGEFTRHLDAAQRFYEIIRDSDSLEFVSDADAAAGSDVSGRTANVAVCVFGPDMVQLVSGVRIVCGVPS
jgi:hypothetical protein